MSTPLGIGTAYRHPFAFASSDECSFGDTGAISPFGITELKRSDR